MRRAIFALALSVGLLASPASVVAVEDPDFRVVVPEPTLVPGQQMQVTVQLVNDADEVDERVRRARNVEVTARSGDTPITVKSGTRTVGDMPDGVVREVPFRVSVPRNLSAGTYRLALEVSYEFGQDQRATQTVHAAFRVEERARFRVLNATTDAPVGDSGTVTLTVRNVGEEPAEDATVTLQSVSPDLRFGQSASASRFVDSWAPGETRTLRYEATVAPGAERRTHALQASVTFDDPDGTRHASATLSTGVTPRPEQSFTLGDVRGDLRVGREGSVTATVTNEGPETAVDAVVVFTGTSQNVHHLEREYAVGTLEPGESATFELPVEVSSAAGDGPRQLSYVLRYQNRDGTVRESDPLNARVTVKPARDRFRVEADANRVAAGSTARVVLVITNRGNETLRNVNAKAFVDDPLSTTDDEAFVGELPPGESATLVFGVSAAGSALEKTYSVSMDLQFETPDGETKLSDTYQAPVVVTTPDDSGGVPVRAVVVGAVLVVAVAVGGWLWFRR